MYKVGIITASDKGSKGQREDISGKVIIEEVEKLGYKVERYVVLPDEEIDLIQEMKYMCDTLKVDFILTTGGTGFSKRDVTPEATKKVIEKEAQGISTAITMYSLKITDRAMLSRAVSGIRGETLIINMPGSPKAVKEVIDYIMPSVKHGLDILKANATECARK